MRMNDSDEIWTAYTSKDFERAPHLFKSKPVSTPLGKLSDKELLAIKRKIQSSEIIQRHNQSDSEDFFQNKERADYIDQVNDELERRNLTSSSPLDLTQPGPPEAI